MWTRGFAQQASRATSIASLATCFVDEGTRALGTAFIGMYAFGPKGIELHGRNLPREIERYEVVGRHHDPVLAAVARLHAPQAASIKALRSYARAHGLPAEYLALLDTNIGRHYMCAPLIVDGVLAGTLNFARRDDRPFGTRELMIASALSLHVSTRMAALRAQPSLPVWEDVLTARGLKVAELAARGLTTRDVGRLLGVSANTVKKHLRVAYERLGVSSRVALAARLRNGPAP